MTGDALCEEIEWQLESGEGWHRAMQAVGYQNPDALARQLYRLGRHDLAAKFSQADPHAQEVNRRGVRIQA